MGKINNSRGPKNPTNVNLNPKLISSNINVVDLDTMIFNQGVRVRVYKTLWCPNVKSIDGVEHDINCPLCKGTEFIDLDCKETAAFIQGQSREHIISPEQIGQNWEEQAVLATFMSGTEISYYTKVELIDYSDPMKELVQRQPSGSEILSDLSPIELKGRKLLFSDSDDLSRVRINNIIIDENNNRFVISKVSNLEGNKYIALEKVKGISLNSPLKIHIRDIDRLQFKGISTDNETIILSESGKRFYEGQDFLLDINGDVEWMPCGDKPSPNSIYTIYYYSLVAYRAIRAIHSNRYLSDSTKKDFLEVVDAPQQWMLKKLYLFKKEDNESYERLEPNFISEK